MDELGLYTVAKDESQAVQQAFQSDRDVAIHAATQVASRVQVSRTRILLAAFGRKQQRPSASLPAAIAVKRSALCPLTCNETRVSVNTGREDWKTCRG